MAAIEEKCLTERQRCWLRHLRACESSGKTMQAYALEAGIGVRSLYDAKKRLKRIGIWAPMRNAAPVRFDRVEVAAARFGRCRIELANGIAVEISEVFDSGTLSQLLRTVAGL